MTTVKDLHDVAQGGGLRGSDDADRSRQSGYRFFASGIEQALGFELCLELLKGDLQGAGTLRFQVLRVDLQLTTVFVNRHSSAQDHLHAIAGTKAQQASGRAKDDNADLRSLVLEREIEMSGVLRAEIRDFAFHP